MASGANYIRELLAIYVAEGVDSAFVNTFALYQLPHCPNPREGSDMGSYGIVKVLEDHLCQSYPDMPWEPEAAFAVLAACYGNQPLP